MFVIDVLISAAAAFAEIWASRLHAMRRRLTKIDKLGFGELLFFAYDLGRDDFAVDGQRNKNRLAFRAPTPFSPKSDVLDF